MQYRKFGKTGIDVSALGFGMMRLPMLKKHDSDTNKFDYIVDVNSSANLLRQAIDEGLNYVDTAYNYLDGESERITGKALQDGYRQKVYLATKAPTWAYNEAADFDRILEEQLNRLQTDMIDFYMLHGMNKYFWNDKVLYFDILSKMEAAKKAGKIRYIGFSFHDDLGTFREIVDYYPDWTFCQIQLNYLDIMFQAGIEGLKYAAARGLGVVIMEPLRGGFLANVPTGVLDIFKGANADREPVEWALDFLWNMPEISLVLSGMGNMQQLQDNLRYAGRASIGMLNEQEEKVYMTVQEQFKKYAVIPCTGCAYCMHCPKGVAIPYVFSAFNEYHTKGNFEKSRAFYREWVPMFGALASECINCHKCEHICPQHIEISKWMPKVDELFR